MFDHLITRGVAAGGRRVRWVVDRLAAVDVPRGVAVERGDDRIILSGRRLRMRFIRDARLRSFADLVRRRLP